MTETEQSVYTRKSIAERAYDPLHASVKELIGKYSITACVLDLGCSDGVATWGMDGVETYGVDTSQAALALATEYQPGFRGVFGDIKHLPFTAESLVETDTVLMLDVLEHEKWEDSVKVLRDLRELLPAGHTLIASMPIFSTKSIETWREGLGVIKRGARPDMGIFDATHRIFTDRDGHHQLLEEGGYSVVEEFQTNHIVGVTGEWQWKETKGEFDLVEKLKSRNPDRSSPIGLANVAIRLYAAFAKQQNQRVRQVGTDLFAYQGLYVARPTL